MTLSTRHPAPLTTRRSTTAVTPVSAVALPGPARPPDFGENSGGGRRRGPRSLVRAWSGILVRRLRNRNKGRPSLRHTAARAPRPPHPVPLLARGRRWLSCSAARFAIRQSRFPYQLCEMLGLAADHRPNDLDVFYAVGIYLVRILRKNHEVGQLSDGDRS